MKLRLFRLAFAALVSAALLLAAHEVSAQSPAATSPSPSPAPSASPAPTASPSPTPSTPPAAAQTPAPTAPAKAADAFGEPINLAPKKVVIARGSATWDNAFDTLVDSLKSLDTLLDKQGITPSGNPMIVYTYTDDAGFTYLAEIPVDQEPKDLPKGITMGQSPDGKALKFVHRGSYDNMDNTYEAITNHLDEKKLEAKDMFIEEYITDPIKTEEDNLVINIYVPLK